MNAPSPERKQYLRCADHFVETPEGSWIVADPTGRDLMDTMEVGQVVKQLFVNEDGEDCALVEFNSSGVVAVTDILVKLQGIGHLEH